MLESAEFFESVRRGAVDHGAIKEWGLVVDLLYKRERVSMVQYYVKKGYEVGGLVDCSGS